MEQIRIRQPKKPAAQSFIQIFGTFFAIFLNLVMILFSKYTINLLISKTSKTIGNTRVNLNNLTQNIKG